MTSWTTSKRCPGMGSMVMIVAVSLLTSPPMVEAWSPLSIRPTAVATGSMSSREDFLKQSVSAAVMASFVLSGNVPAARAINYYEESGSTATAEASIPVAKVGEIVNLANGVTYEVKQAGTGPKPLVGELAAIRFSAYCGTNKIDDVFDTPEPYYTRVGSGALLKGVEATIPLMRVGDRWTLTIPVRTRNTTGGILVM